MTDGTGAGTEGGTDALAVTVRRTGGFAGVARAWTLSLGDVDEELGGRLRALAGEAVAAPPPPAPPRADGFRWSVVLHSPGGDSALEAPESALPPALAELVGLVREHGAAP
ncbi:hypothetical protein EV189_1530 [Motilibacter rhizosphaerae]|uniref:Uncharacterized protein n=1 Tax=Motilibacter rhizosphaerae TaxID=598652 RepID=A0A4Q7NRQ6_9ACTN|nr:protealysin inhibitor emfourin [Motilibacter rhizosphaerae]RZS89757.1 hypothetical protein EV189_1530 [Motilibacter rhizosphaerae]